MNNPNKTQSNHRVPKMTKNKEHLTKLNAVVDELIEINTAMEHLYQKQIDMVIRQEVDLLGSLTEEQIKSNERLKKLSDKLGNSLKQLTDDSENGDPVTLQTVVQNFSTDSTKLKDARENLINKVESVARLRKQLTDLLEFAHQQTGQFLHMIQELGNAHSVHYRKDGAMDTGGASSVAINQKA